MQPVAHEDTEFMRVALRVAAAGLAAGELPIGAVVVYGETILAEAWTAERTERRRLVHAELRALDLADRLHPFPGARSDTRLYTTLEPCLMCLGAAMSFGIGEVHYSLESPGDGATALVQQWQRDEAAMPTYRLPRIMQHTGSLRRASIDLFAAYTARHSSGSMWEWAKTLAAR
jgi:tRNA(adenine34) deaminase